MKTVGGYLKRAVFAHLFVWFFAMVAWASASGQKDEAAALPEGAGRALMLQACVQCHDFKSIVSQRKTADAWRRTVNEMIWRGAPLLADEAGILTDYLAGAFGAGSASSSSIKPSAKTPAPKTRSEEHTSELQSLRHLVCRLLLEK